VAIGNSRARLFHHSNAIRGARPEEREIPKGAKSRRALNSELREIPEGRNR